MEQLPGYAGLAEPYAFVDEGPILRLTETREKRQRRAYRLFVEAGVAETDDQFRKLLKTSRWGIGDEAFQTRVRDLHTEQSSYIASILQQSSPTTISIIKGSPQ